MKDLSIILAILLLLTACKKDKQVNPDMADHKEITVAEKIAQANGIDKWKDVNEIRFTFNVDRPDSHFERSWIWHPKTDDVTSMTANDTVTYNRKNIDSTNMRADRGFINDKFWLLAPFNLVWDEGTTISYQDSVKTNITGEIFDQLTITYGSEGGYTPGDAYDFYYDKDFMIREWVFRKSAQETPSMITTWEDYADFNGLKIARTHKGKDNGMTLYFTNISVN